MRAARRQDAWRHVAEWGIKSAVTAIETAGLAGFTAGRTNIPGGLALFCGVNSAGKTRLPASLFKSLQSFVDTGDPTVLGGLEVSSTPPSGVTFLDSLWSAQRQRVSIGRDASVGDRIEQAGLTDLRSDQLRITKYLLGRDYEAIRVAELDSTDDEFFLEEFVGGTREH